MSPASLGADIGRQGHPNNCVDVYAPSFWLGRPGSLTQVRMPSVGITRELDDKFAVHDLLDGQSVDRSPYGCRTWGISYEWLKPSDMSTLMEFATRQRGFGPFIWHDPQIKNLLSPNQASGTDALRTTEGFSVNSVPTATVIDTYSRAVTGDWGSTTSGQAWSESGTLADYSVDGSRGRITPSAVNSDRIALVFCDNGNDHVAQVEVTFNTLPASGSLRAGVIGRAIDTANYYLIYLQTTSAGVPSLVLSRRVGGVGTTPATVTPLNVSTVVAGTAYIVKTEVIGDVVRGKVWAASSGEPNVWDIDQVDTSLATGTQVGAFGRNESAVTTHILIYDNFSATPGDAESLTSTDVASIRGTQSLGWHLPGTVQYGVLTLDAPTGLYGWSIPAGTNWAFSGWLRTSTGDVNVAVTPRIVWKDLTGAQSGPAVSGSSVAVVDTSWQSFCVTGAAPGDMFLTVQLVTSSASVTGSAGATVLVDELQLEMNDECTTWEYGQGQALVAIRAERETIPRILRTNVGFTLIEVT